MIWRSLPEQFRAHPDLMNMLFSLAWKGAHIGVAWSPCGRYVVSALQEKELHGWDLVTMQDFRMGGYPRKTQAMAWTADHRRHSPYPLRHNASNVFVAAERGDEIDLESYLFVTRIADRTPSTLSSGIVHWTLRLGPDGYRLVRKDVVLDSIESAPFDTIPEVSPRMATWQPDR